MKTYIYPIIFSLVLCACDTDKTDSNSGGGWLDSVKQPTIAWFNSLLATNKPGEEKAEQAAENDDNRPDEDAESAPETETERDQQAQAQIIGAMENMSAAPADTGAAQAAPETETLSSESLAQRHAEFDKAASIGDKVDALSALVQADPKNATTILRDAYADTEPDVRREAVMRMAAFKNQPAIIDLLIKAANDSDETVAIEAVEGLAHIQDKKVLAALKKIAKSYPDETVRIVAGDYAEQLEQGSN